jgi:uncharacterized membrane protein YphA (DoxX/SURF4 family)
MMTSTTRPAGWWFLGVARIVMGYMWYEQTLWKLPPNWGGPGGLRHWVEMSGQYAVPWYRSFVNGFVLPNFGLFAPLVWAGETVIAITLASGFLGRFGGLLSALMGINLLLANGRLPNEWYWSYVFIALFGFTFFFTRAGRYLGVDALMIRRVENLAMRRPRLGRVLLWLM